MVNSIANISTLLDQSGDFLKGSVGRHAQPGGNTQLKESESVTIDEAGHGEDIAENIREFAGELSEYVGDKNLALEFSKDDETQKMVMKLVNGETKEVVKQFPPEISLKIARILSQSQSGNLANAKV
jgi:flagellar protein FlaG